MGRCYNKNKKYYECYGGRGITVCDEWRGNDGVRKFVAFIKKLGWFKGCGLQIDRIDNSKGYAPDNIKLSGPSENAFNTRRLQKNNTSGYRGVHFIEESQKFMAYITVNRKRFHLGLHKDIKDAVSARNRFIAKNKIKGAHFQEIK